MQLSSMEVSCRWLAAKREDVLLSTRKGKDTVQTLGAVCGQGREEKYPVGCVVGGLAEGRDEFRLAAGREKQQVADGREATG